MCIKEMLLIKLSCSDRNSKIALIFSTYISHDGVNEGQIRVIVTTKKIELSITIRYSV